MFLICNNCYLGIYFNCLIIDQYGSILTDVYNRRLSLLFVLPNANEQQVYPHQLQLVSVPLVHLETFYMRSVIRVLQNKLICHLFISLYALLITHYRLKVLSKSCITFLEQQFNRYGAIFVNEIFMHLKKFSVNFISDWKLRKGCGPMLYSKTANFLTMIQFSMIQSTIQSASEFVS